MSTDATQIMQQPNSAPALTIEDVIKSQAGPIVTQLTSQAVGSLKSDVASLFGNHDANVARITTLEANLAATAASVEDSLVTRVKADPKIQAALILGTVGACLVGALAILIAALLGSHQANEWIGYAAGLFGTSVVAIITHALGLLGPTNGPTASATVVATPPVTTTTTVGA